MRRKPFKEPKTFKHPRLYYRPNYHEGYPGRFRIVHPYGYVEYAFESQMQVNEWGRSCYSRAYYKTGAEGLKAMRRYDKECNQKQALFLGEIK